MRERNITRGDIVNAIRDWKVRTPPHGDRGIGYEGPGLSGRTLKVWVLPPGYVDEDTTIVVKSVACKDGEGV